VAESGANVGVGESGIDVAVGTGVRLGVGAAVGCGVALGIAVALGASVSVGAGRGVAAGTIRAVGISACCGASCGIVALQAASRAAKSIPIRLRRVIMVRRSLSVSGSSS